MMVIATVLSVLAWAVLGGVLALIIWVAQDIARYAKHEKAERMKELQLQAEKRKEREVLRKLHGGKPFQFRIEKAYRIPGRDHFRTRVILEGTLIQGTIMSGEPITFQSKTKKDYVSHICDMDFFNFNRTAHWMSAEEPSGTPMAIMILDDDLNANDIRLGIATEYVRPFV